MKILVSFDTTGSMRPASKEVERRLGNFVTEVLHAFPNCELGFIAHGDYNDAYDPTFSGYTSNPTALAMFLSRIGTTSGFGNGGECYEWVMHIANNLQPDIFIMIGDEPAHVSTRIARYDWRQELAQLVKTAKVYQVRCLNRDDSRAYHQEVANTAGTPLLSLAQFNNVVELLAAIIHRESNTLEEYSGRITLNRNLAELIDSLLGSNKSAQFVSNRPAELIPVDPSRFQVLTVTRECAIADFVNDIGIPYKKGRGFYKLDDRELIQENKEVVLRDRRTGEFFTGPEARNLIGLPYGQRGKISVHMREYDVFVQSTSVNRKLKKGADFLYET